MPLTSDYTGRINRYDQVPLHQQVAATIRAAIDDGVLRPGEALPSEHDMAAMMDISRGTVRDSVNDLVQAGLVVKRSGRPTRVATPPQVRRMSTQRYQEALDLIRANAGTHPKSSAFTRDHDVEWAEHNVLAEYEQGGATAAFAQHLGLGEGDPVLYRKLLKQVHGETVQLQTSVMPLAQVAGTPVADPNRQPWPGGTIAELFSLGCVVTRVTEEVQVRPPTAEERKRLNLVAEGPVMEVTRVFFTADGPVECSLAVVEATSYRLWFETELT